MYIETDKLLDSKLITSKYSHYSKYTEDFKSYSEEFLNKLKEINKANNPYEYR